MTPQLMELIHNYEPDILWTDGDWYETLIEIMMVKFVLTSTTYDIILCAKGKTTFFLEFYRLSRLAI